MKEFNSEFFEIEFQERPVVSDIEGASEHAIWILDPNDNQSYCKTLLDRLIQFRKKEYLIEFVNHQLYQLDHLTLWLNSLKLLLDKNVDFFVHHRKEFLLPILYSFIEDVIEQMGGVIEKPKATHLFSDAYDSKYDIEVIKQYLAIYPSIPDKIKYLNRVKTDFLQEISIKKNPWKTSFDQQVELEIQYLNLANQYRSQNNFSIKQKKYVDRLMVIGNLTSLAQSFRALLEQTGDKGKKYLDISHQQWLYFLYGILQDEHGQPVDTKILFKSIIPRIKNRQQQWQAFQQYCNQPFKIKVDCYQYDIQYIKTELEKIPLYEDRLLLLHRVYTNFLQHQRPNAKDDYFTTQINLELNHQRVEFDLLLKNKRYKTKPVSIDNKIRVNGRVNVMMTFFYELLVEFERQEIRCFKTSKQKVINIVHKYFIKSTGEAFGKSNLRNTLTPEKWDKRCKSPNRVKIKKYWKNDQSKS